MADDLALRVATYKVLADYAKDRYDEARAQMAARMHNGDRLAAVDARGVKLAAVTKRDPKPEARITDMAKLRAWVATHYEDHLVSGIEVTGSDPEVHEVLIRHAPHLLREVQKVSPDLVRLITDASKKAGAPVGPGGEADVPGVTVQTSEGTVSCLPTDEALGVVVGMLQSGELDLFDVLPVGGDV
ncbi:hypothetical protein [Amycolatopsis thermoflava]|uniref:hypothetical protein n=1 Tax=Amycolatopsis thermoflava TaxID=84480 RepID=UPI003F4A805B